MFHPDGDLDCIMTWYVLGFCVSVELSQQQGQRSLEGVPVELHWVLFVCALPVGVAGSNTLWN